MQSSSLQQQKQRKRLTFARTILLCASTGGISFYVGALWGIQAGMRQALQECGTASESKQNLDHKSQQENLFPNTVRAFATGMALVDRDEFAQRFDVGVPLDASSATNKQVLFLYNKDATMPNSTKVRQSVKSIHSPIPSISVTEATQNCDRLNLIMTDFTPLRNQCVAIMGQYESFHIHRYMRLQGNVPGHSHINRTVPLRLVSRGLQENGRQSANTPTKSQTVAFWNTLSAYLQSLDSVLAELAPIAKQVADDQNTVIVMVCNDGQSELLMNFVCTAKGRGLDTSHVLVFATDIETKALAEGLGLKAFYDETNFGAMPKRAARGYGDATFTAMMMAKVFCVQMTAMLGYDVLFQDVDVVWYKDPLEYFHNTSSPDYGFDIYFQDDGNRGLYYSPYSANTGFYYARQNDRTLHFFNSLLLAGDLVKSTHSHQIALIALLSEHASLYGMKVKVMGRDGSDFPGGYHYHVRTPFMKDVMTEKVIPYVFHMSWTLNKENKINFLQQSGNWYVQPKCLRKTDMNTLLLGSEEGRLISPCCAAEPLITCHFRDKPSKIPCKSSPNLDKKGRSFW